MTSDTGGKTQSIDREVVDLLAGRGLRLGLVDTATEDFERWLRVELRGFHGRRRNAQEVGRLVHGAAHRRTLAVWDERDRAEGPGSEGENPDPVATLSSWIAPLSVPGPEPAPTVSADDTPRPADRPQAEDDRGGDTGASRADATRDVAAWAISSVTVAPTHRRRGIARGLLESELRAAREAGVPVAMLTVSEATIYGRYGFAPAARAADLRLDTRRAGWRGTDPVAASRGAIRFLPLDVLHRVGRGVFEAARRRTPGQTPVDDALWDEVTCATGSQDDEAAAAELRAVCYETAAGREGFALYRVTPTRDEEDFTAHRATLRHLCAVTEDAYAALWHFLVDLDLVSRLDAPLRSVDEPLRWLIRDQRALQVTRDYDHLWVRLVDVPAALAARGYRGPARLGFEIADPMGLAPDRVLLDIDEAGIGQARAVDVLPEDVPAVSLGVAELGALYLGGVSAQTLARAGRLTPRGARAAALLDRAFHSPVAPWLNIWF